MEADVASSEDWNIGYLEIYSIFMLTNIELAENIIRIHKNVDGRKS